MGTWAEFYGETPGRKINFDRGVSWRTFNDNGGRVCMYKSQPGLYLNEMSAEVDDALARKAGFDVAGDRKEAVILKEIAEAEAIIRARVGTAEAEIRGRVAADDETPTPFDAPVTESPPAADAEKPVTDAEADKQAPKTVVLSELFTTHGAHGQPRGTEHYVMHHSGFGRWDVLAREGGAKAMKNKTMEDALLGLIKAEESFIKGEKASSG